MAALLKVHRVTYECSCHQWAPITSLYFCKHCQSIKCQNCTSIEIDSLFCPCCLENSPAAEARLKKFRCINCNQCPLCGQLLSARTSAEKVHLACASCRWSTRDAQVEDQASAANWPIHEFPFEEELQNVMEKLRGLASIEKAQRDQRDQKRRSATSGYRLTDKFGLQQIYERRRKCFEKATVDVPVHEAIQPAPFSEDFLSAKPRPSLDQICRQPLAGNKPLWPVRVLLKTRKAVRCVECDHTLVKLEYGTSAIKYKLNMFARNFLPELRLSREPELKSDESSPVMLSVTNNTSSKIEVVLSAENGEGLVECSTREVSLTLPSSEDSSDLINVSPEVEDQHEAIIFRKRNRVGIRVQVVEASEASPQLGLVLRCRHDASLLPAPLKPEEKSAEPKWHELHVKVQLTE